MWNKVMAILAGTFGTAALAALGIDIFEHHKVAKKVGISVEELGKVSKDSIKEALVERAVECAAERGVEEQLKRVRNEVLAEARSKLSEEVRKAVKEANDIIQKEVSEKIGNEAALIDMTALKKSARDKAEAKILEKFDGNLEDLLEKFNENLANIKRIYGGIADAISEGRDKDKEKTIKFSVG